MNDYMGEYVEIVNPIIPLFEDMCNRNERRAVLHHKVGLVNAAISIQQFIVYASHIQKNEGELSIQRLSGLLASIFHLQSDRMAFMSDMDDEILEAVAEGMYPMIGKVIETMGVDWDGTYGE